MKKHVYIWVGLCFMSLSLFACQRPAASEVASKFCGLMEKKHNATTEDEKKKIHEEMEAYEKKIKKAYKDKDYQKEIKKAISECADELEAKYGDIDR